MAVVLHYLQYALGRLLYSFRGHDSGQIIYTPAFDNVPQPNMKLESDCGPSGSNMPIHCTCLAADGKGVLPELYWTPPESDEPVKEYVLICEDIDLPVPFLVVHHGLFWAIPASAISAVPADVKAQDYHPKLRRTVAGWRFVSNPLGSPYSGAAPPLGHGGHRYVFTIIALNAELKFEHPEKATKQDIKRAMVGKVIGWGQWIGVFERPWPN